MKNLNNKKLIRAKQRVEEIKKFYKHAVAYILVNLFLAFIWNFSFKLVGDFTISNQFNSEGFTHIPIWFIWGFFLAIHALKTFGFSSVVVKNWEQKKIDEFMKE